MTAVPRASPMRSFDPCRVGELECATWIAYYERDWWRFLRVAVALVRHGFGMHWPATLYGAGLVLRANQLWAAPKADAEGARRCMRRFYALVARCHGEQLDVDEAARLEVDWWRVHNELRVAADGSVDTTQLTDAVQALYAHVYGVEPQSVRPAAELRAQAMVDSDRWVAQGCPPGSPLLAAERAALVRAYAALLAAVYR